MATFADLNAKQPKIPEPWLPEHFLDDEKDLHEILEELARQLTVINDFYYPLLAAASKLKTVND